jgi:hypothetical protein
MVPPTSPIPTTSFSLPAYSFNALKSQNVILVASSLAAGQNSPGQRLC